MPPLLRVNGLTKRFGGLAALDDVSFEINEGEIVGLIGPNGAGKTTLVRLIIGLFKPNQGEVEFKGKDITGHRPWDNVGEGIAMTHQVVKPFHSLPVIANVMIGCLAKGASKRGEWVKTIEARSMDALEFVGLSDMAKEKAGTLSHGDLKRLEVARALATEPWLLVLDEPFGGLNPAEINLMIKSIAGLRKGGRFGRLHSRGLTILIVEHEISDLVQIADRLIVLNYGRLIAEGDAKEVITKKEVIEAYLGAMEA